MSTRRPSLPANPPEDAAASGVRRRRVLAKLAAVVLAVAAITVGLLPGHLLDRSRSGSGPRAPSWAMPPLAARAVGGGGWAWDPARAGAAVAFMYVDEQCLHCKAELARWDELARESGQGSRLWVVASPGSDVDGAAWVPLSLRARIVHDLDGSIAAALQVRAVPTTFWVDATDTVRIVTVGQSGKEALVHNMQTIMQNMETTEISEYD